MLVAIFRARPSPFYVMDEVEAALDDANLGRLIGLFEQLRTQSQLIVITHQKATMEVADALYGVSMQGDGITAVISQRMRGEDLVGSASPYPQFCAGAKFCQTFVLVSNTCSIMNSARWTIQPSSPPSSSGRAPKRPPPPGDSPPSRSWPAAAAATTTVPTGRATPGMPPPQRCRPP